MSKSDASETEILIVGGGPVGMGLAIELGQRGVRCTAVERHERPLRIPKGQNLAQRTMEHFHFWGAEKALRAARTIPKDYGIGGLTAYGTLLGGHTHDFLQRELVRSYYFTDNERLPQYVTEEVLRRRAGALPSVEILYGWSAEDVRQDCDGAAVDIAERDGPRRRSLRAKFLVGCDGSHSLVRERAGITQTRSDHDRLMVLLVFRSTGLHGLLERFPGKSFYKILHPDLKGYWRFLGRVDLGSTWFFHAPVPPGTTAETFDAHKHLQTAIGAEFDVEIEHLGFWELRVAVADSYRSGRIFIAGDAAHSHPPYGGYGVNTGFEDARNLGWKLAAVLRGWHGNGLLDSYDEERRPVFASTARDFIEKTIETDRRFVESHNPDRDGEAFGRAWAAFGSGSQNVVTAYEPNYRGSSIVWGPPDAVCDAKGVHSFAARAGHHLAPQPLSSGRNVFEELGEWFTLLALDADAAAVGAFETAAGELQVPLKIVEDSRADGRERYEARMVLVRPDQFVAWASDVTPDSALEILGKVIGGR